eukprot:6746229-Prymnesium_polylepis.2
MRSAHADHSARGGSSSGATTKRTRGACVDAAAAARSRYAYIRSESDSRPSVAYEPNGKPNTCFGKFMLRSERSRAEEGARSGVR